VSLRKALSWSAAQTVVRLCLGFASAKISAVYLGPPGVALVGQLTSFLQLMQGAISTAANTAIVNLTAERRSSPARLDVLWATALRIVWALSFAACGIVAVVSMPVSDWLLGDSRYWAALLLCGIAIVIGASESAIASILNGLKQVDLIAKINIGSSILEVSLFAVLVYFYGLWGGLIGTSAMYAVRILVTASVAMRTGHVSLSSLKGHFNRQDARAILHFYPMLLAQAIALPLAQIVVRNLVIDGTSLTTAGHLQSAWRLSDMYVGVMTTALGLYFMAHYSGLSIGQERAKVLRTTVLQVLALAILAAGSVYALRNLIITLVLTKDFLPMGELLPFHLIGDVLKLAGYPLAMALVAERRSAWYIAQAGGGPLIFAVATMALLPTFQAQAAPMAYALSHLAAFLLMAFAHRGKFLVNETNDGKK
jgi:PST family polysaccharide transporter